MKDLGHDDIVKAMVGRTVERFQHDIHAPHQDSVGDANDAAAPRLSVKGLKSPGKFEDITFDVRPGEIVGLGGLLGAGRTEVARAIFGVDPFQSGTVEVDGKQRRIKNPKDGMRAGIIMVPEERKSQGLVLDMMIHENLTVSDPGSISTAGWLSPGRARKVARDLIDRLSIKANGPDVVVRTLSGGNQQKVVIGRCFLNEFPVYIFDEPTRGVDVNAKFQIYRLVSALAKRGAGVLVISSELPELLAISDRILVMRDGRIVDEIDAEEATEQRILSSAMV
jgi:ABC-type sugar transport system ATPase subunit